MRSKPMIFLVISFLVVALIYSSFSEFVSAVPRDPKNTPASTSCTTNKDGSQTCCWRVRVSGQILADEYCQICASVGSNDCKSPVKQAILEQPPTPPPTPGPAARLQDGGVLEQPPTGEVTPPLTEGERETATEEAEEPQVEEPEEGE
jgi:hypothetical protein